jgi:hypothetical protein
MLGVVDLKQRCTYYTTQKNEVNIWLVLSPRKKLEKQCLNNPLKLGM